MRTVVNIGGSQAMALKGALLVYEGGSGAFAAWHEAKSAEDGGAPYLSEAEPLTTDFLRGLAAGLGTYLAPEILPPNVLVRTPEVLVWWTPAQQRTMFFAEHSEAGRELFGGQRNRQAKYGSQDEKGDSTGRKSSPCRQKIPLKPN